MNIKITSKDGVTLKTKGKYCTEDISVAVDDSLTGITPTGTYEVVENGEYDITQYAKVNVNVPTGGGGSEENLPTDLSYMFYKNDNITNVEKFCIDWFSYTSKVTSMSYMFFYCQNLETIPLLNTSNVNDMSYMFGMCSKLTTIPLLDTSKATSMSYMFQNCKNLETIPLSNTSKVTHMNYMFASCSKLTSVPQLDTSEVATMSYMFNQCTALETIPLLNTSKVTNMSSMFASCTALKRIDITHWDIQSTSYCKNWCQMCYSLKTVIIRNFGTNHALNSTAFNGCYHLKGTVDATYNPDGLKDGYIYVPRSMVSKLSSATNWATYASQLRALEDYTVDGTTTGELDESKI